MYVRSYINHSSVWTVGTKQANLGALPLPYFTGALVPVFVRYGTVPYPETRKVQNFMEHPFCIAIVKGN